MMNPSFSCFDDRISPSCRTLKRPRLFVGFSGGTRQDGTDQDVSYAYSGAPGTEGMVDTLWETYEKVMANGPFTADLPRKSYKYDDNC